jgi:hypothetical protein
MRVENGTGQGLSGMDQFSSAVVGAHRGGLKARCPLKLKIQSHEIQRV